MTADGLATALFFVDAKKLRDVADFQFVRLFANGKSEHSPEIMGQLYI
jgi:FAD:protein FMN transferase